MLTSTPASGDATADASVARHRWIDVLLLGGGVWCLCTGWFQLGIPLLAFSLVMPALRWVGRRRTDMTTVVHLVPSEMADSYRRVLDAACLPGIVDPDEVVEAAGDTLIETAALLAGRRPQGRAQRRFVAARVLAFDDTAAALRERHQAWVSAHAEVRAISTIVFPEPSIAVERDRLATTLAVLLFPFFLTWDLGRALTYAVVALLDGLALRLRTVGTLGTRAGRNGIAALGRAWGAWRRTLARLQGAVEEARHRVDAASLRLRLRVRRVRYRVRRLRLG